MGRARLAVPARRGARAVVVVEIERNAGGKIAECWLVPLRQYLFDELRS